MYKIFRGVIRTLMGKYQKFRTYLLVNSKFKLKYKYKD
jgi:hypothetical protein